MFPVSLPVGSICFALLLSAVSSQPTYLVPQQRSEGTSLEFTEPITYDPVELYNQILQNDDYAVAAAESTELSILDYILSPVTAVLGLGSTALSVVSWIVVKGGLVLLGMAIVLAFCGLTPYCTLTIEKPSFLSRENLSAFPYLEDLESFFNEAYNKYEQLQRNLS